MRSDAERHVAACKTSFYDVSARRVPSLRHLDTFVATRRADTSGGHDTWIRRVASRVSDTSDRVISESLGTSFDTYIVLAKAGLGASKGKQEVTS